MRIFDRLAGERARVRAIGRLAILLAVVVPLSTAGAGCRGRPAFAASDLAGYWVMQISGETKLLAFEPQDAADFRVRILGDPMFTWTGTLRDGMLSLSGLLVDGGGPRFEARFTGQVFPLGDRDAEVISGELTLSYFEPGRPGLSVPAALLRSRQDFAESYWALNSSQGDRVVIGVVTDPSAHFISGGFTGWPRGEGEIRSCRFLQCGGEVFDFRDDNGVICFKTDAADAGCGGVALLCLEAATGTGMSWHVGCARGPMSQPFVAAGPFTRLEQIRFSGQEH